MDETPRLRGSRKVEDIFRRFGALRRGDVLRKAKPTPPHQIDAIIADLLKRGVLEEYPLMPFRVGGRPPKAYRLSSPY